MIFYCLSFAFKNLNVSFIIHTSGECWCVVLKVKVFLTKVGVYPSFNIGLLLQWNHNIALIVYLRIDNCTQCITIQLVQTFPLLLTLKGCMKWESKNKFSLSPAKGKGNLTLWVFFLPPIHSVMILSIILTIWNHGGVLFTGSVCCVRNCTPPKKICSNCALLPAQAFFLWCQSVYHQWPCIRRDCQVPLLSSCIRLQISHQGHKFRKYLWHWTHICWLGV